MLGKIELGMRRIPFDPKSEIKLAYKGQPLKQTYQPDFTCFDKMILEVKAVSDLTDEHRAQVHNYLKATGYRLGFLVNFGAHGKLQYERSRAVTSPPFLSFVKFVRSVVPLLRSEWVRHDEAVDGGACPDAIRND